MAGEQQTPYDRLLLTRIILFIALILLVNALMVTVFYTFYLEKPFHQVLTAERQAFGDILSSGLHQSMRYSGDRVYDIVFVSSNLERMAYDSLRAGATDDGATRAVKELRMFGRIFDDLFDYGLLLCYRLGFLLVTMTFLGCLIVAVAIHGAVLRHRKRYGFGDTALLLNLWARALTAWAIPVTFLIWTLPVALGPVTLSTSLALCTACMIAFSFSLPKIA